MQKKIYPLLLVPCSLALCLALFFLTSCGDDKDDPPPQIVLPSSSSFVLPPSKNDPRVTVSGLDISLSAEWRLKVLGQVSFNPTVLPSRKNISSILINMHNKDTDKLIPIDTIKVNMPIVQDSEVEDLSDAKAFDFRSCELNKARYQIYVYVYLSDDTTIAKIDSLPEPFKKTHPECQTYTLTINSSPVAGGSVSPAPEGPYSKNQPVTLRAEPQANYAFYNWTNDYGSYKDYAGYANPYPITIDGDIKLIANFVESRTLEKQAPEDVNDGGVINSVKFIHNSFEAQGNAVIIELFQSPEYGIDDALPYNQQPLDMYGIPEPSKTHQFISNVSPETTTIDFTPGRYFVVKTASSGWSNWSLLLGKNRSPQCTTPTCVEVTVWKAK